MDGIRNKNHLYYRHTAYDVLCKIDIEGNYKRFIYSFMLCSINVAILIEIVVSCSDWTLLTRNIKKNMSILLQFSLTLKNFKNQKFYTKIFIKFKKNPNLQGKSFTPVTKSFQLHKSLATDTFFCYDLYNFYYGWTCLILFLYSAVSLVGRLTKKWHKKSLVWTL